MPISLTYIAVAILAYFGVDNAEQVVEAVLVLVVAAVAFYGRYRAGGITITGMRK